MPSINPIKPILGSLGSSLGSVASGALDSAMDKIWTFATTLLTGSFGLIAKLARPDLDPRSGALASVLPTILWCGGLTVFVLALVQIARSVMAGGRGFGTLFIGIGQYLIITAGGLGFLSVLVVAADGLAVGILSAGLGVNGWQGINAQNSVWLNSAHAVGGVGVGLTALFLVIPAAIGLLIEAMVRYAAIVILAATIPILAAGLVNESTTKWFWTGLRWMVALLLLTPATALVMVIGLRGAAAAAGADGQHGSIGASTVQLVVGGVIMLISLLCPIALFKLLAFLDPNTGAGMQMRSYFAGSGSQSGSSAGANSADSDDGEGETERRFAGAGGGLLAQGALGQGQGMAASSSATAGSMLDSVGAGHSGSNPQPAKRSNGSSQPSGGQPGGGSSGSGMPEGDVQSPTPSPNPTGPAPTPAMPSAPGAAGAFGSGGAAGGASAAEAGAAVVAL